MSGEEIFSHYAYFSSYSDSWVAHAKRYVDDAAQRLGLGPDSFVVEVASNDGYLLQHVVARGIRCLGIEPAANVAEAAVEKGIPTEVVFLGRGDRREGREPCTVRPTSSSPTTSSPTCPTSSTSPRACARSSPTPAGSRIEIPHLLRLIEGNEYDTIYHEHYSYLSLLTTQRVLAAAGLTVVDVEELPTHGGSLRTWSAPHRARTRALGGGRARARRGGRGRPRHRRGARRLRRAGGRRAQRPAGVPHRLLAPRARRSWRTAPRARATRCSTTAASAPTSCAFTVDRNPFKHGKFLPGTHIPIHPVEALAAARPDYVLIMPWNLREEISRPARPVVRDWGGRLVVALPHLEVI